LTSPAISSLASYPFQKSNIIRSNQQEPQTRKLALKADLNLIKSVQIDLAELRNLWGLVME